MAQKPNPNIYRLHFPIPLQLKQELAAKVKVPGAINPDALPRGYWKAIILPYLEAYNKDPKILTALSRYNITGDTEELDNLLEKK